ncbi:MAG: translesion error-prone DNA polymerase V autoproteolytic subunit [Candidatus Obscuribacterales bacterium]
MEESNLIPKREIGSQTSAGFPSPADDHLQLPLDLNQLLIKNHPATFFLRVKGSAMLASGIHDADILIVDRSITATNGKIVVATVDGELIVRRFQKQAGGLCLTADDESPPINLSENDSVEIWGVATSVVHHL